MMLTFCYVSDIIWNAFHIFIFILPNDLWNCTIITSILHVKLRLTEIK